MKTPKQIAEQIVDHLCEPYPITYSGLTNLIEQAIQAEREREIPWPNEHEVPSRFSLESIQWVKKYVEKKMSEQ